MTDDRKISCVEAVYSAWDRMELLLFHPFDMGRWFMLGFAAWLANIGQSGIGFNFSMPDFSQVADMHQSTSQAGNGGVNLFNQIFPSDMFNGILVFVLIAIVIAVLIFSVAIAVIFLWVRSRGAFIFIHDLATGTTEISRPWREYSRQGNSLFLLRIAYGAVMVMLFLICVVLTILMLLGAIISHSLNGMGIAGIVFGIISLFSLVMLGILIELCIENIVIPVMYRKKLSSWEAIYEFVSMTNDHAMPFVRFFLMYLLLELCAAVAIAVFIFSTCCFCCMGLVLLSLPYIWAVVTLPLLTFFRLYGIEFLGQFGDEYRIMPKKV